MKMLLVPWAEKLLVCRCGEEFDTTAEVQAHQNSGQCRENAPQATGTWVSWILNGAGRHQYKPEMPEEKKVELKQYYEEHKDEILARRKHKAEARKRLMAASMGRKRGR